MSAVAEFDRARARLAGAPTELLGELVQPRRLLGIARSARIVERGRAWHLGVLLITQDAVLATGEIIRSREQMPRGYTAQSQRERAELAGAAFRGGIPEGRVVHIGWHEIDPAAVDRGEASGPLAQVDGTARVRWSSAGGFMPLAAYLDERIGLLLEPPAGAS